MTNDTEVETEKEFKNGQKSISNYKEILNEAKKDVGLIINQVKIGEKNREIVKDAVDNLHALIVG